MTAGYSLSPFHKGYPQNIKTGIWASIVSATMLVGIAIFWVVHPYAAEGSFKLVPDSDAAIGFSKIAALFKAVCDVLPPLFVFLAIRFGQFRLAGLFHIVTLLLVIIPDMVIWGLYVPNVGIFDILQHTPFAIPICVAAYYFLKPTPNNY